MMYNFHCKLYLKNISLFLCTNVPKFWFLYVKLLLIAEVNCLLVLFNFHFHYFYISTINVAIFQFTTIKDNIFVNVFLSVSDFTPSFYSEFEKTNVKMKIKIFNQLSKVCKEFSIINNFDCFCVPINLLNQTP